MSTRRGKSTKINCAMRLRLEEAINHMLEVLDALDAPTEDLEPGLGSTTNSEWHSQAFWGWSEPSLGSFDRMTNQEHSYRNQGGHGESDLEVDKADREPSLGSRAVNADSSQEQWATGGTCDLEFDPAEAGIADTDGLAEQIASAVE
jgi:hypothetical protein